MAQFRCKMCGGSLEIGEGQSIATCEYCGTKQTLPRLDDERRAQMYDRANHFRRNNEFDKAMGIYEQILGEDNTDSEAYWSIVLCRYGIEYVEDPASKRRMPTVNRAQFTSIFDDENYRSALSHCDALQRAVYEAEAKEINEIQKGILAISQKEEPFDVFICYKETDQNGRRTLDSVLAQDLYHQLTKEGLKVFFARITLEDKLGSAYEPYIFAALNSAKVMVVLGTRAEHFNATWVKNEWSRFLSLVKQSHGEKVLVPAYKGMDPYGLPEEFSHLQAQDMDKLGFMQDLVRGVVKIARPNGIQHQPVRETVAQPTSNIAPLLDRGQMFIDDGDWKGADECFERALDQDPRCAAAYVGKLLVEKKLKKKEDLATLTEPFDNSNNYQKAIRFADDALKAELQGYQKAIKKNAEEAKHEVTYQKALKMMDNSTDGEALKQAAEIFKSISGYKDSDELYEECQNGSERVKLAKAYTFARRLMTTATTSYDYSNIINILSKIPDYKDVNKIIAECQRLHDNLKLKEDEQREEIRKLEEAQELERRQAEERSKARKKMFLRVVSVCIICAIAVTLCVQIFNSVSKVIKYNKIQGFIDEGNYEEAYILADEIFNYKDCEDIKAEMREKVIEKADKLYMDGDVQGAADLIDYCGINYSAYKSLLLGNYQSAVSGGITHIEIPAGTTTVGYREFAGCEKLESVVIPDGVTRIGEEAFSGCSSLTTIVIPDSVVYIDRAAFRNCTNLTEVKMSNNVEVIGNYAFSDCLSLKKIDLPDSLKTIGNYAFEDCKALGSVTLGNRVESIGDFAFSRCVSLTKIFIPISVESVGEQIVYGCQNVILYSPLAAQPDGWNDTWNSGRTVIWNSSDK